jgi:cysteine desulfurase
MRAGTENTPGIVGLGVALEARAERMMRGASATRAMRDAFEASLTETGIVSRVNGASAPRLPNTSNVCFEPIDGEALTIRLDQSGVRCSQSSACTNHRPEPSYVLRAMGLPEDEAYASIRFGFSELNSMAEVATAVSAVTELHQQLSRFAIA